ncbi:MAG: GntR family transcriptional regulator [Gammaproteobacteria bacterium]|nr:GntR family transcriptional regulator [Gammaproteobacteria bacterium]
MTASIHEEIANTLTREILTGQYRPGERLPSERDLAARFDVNRGAVREALKKLEGLHLADIQPGGARVAPVEEASLDVIGHMLELDEVPSDDLVEQILLVVAALIGLAADNAVQRATDEEIEALRVIVGRLRDAAIAGDDDYIPRIELMQTFMDISGNLVSRLIARVLISQFASRMTHVVRHHQIDQPGAIAAVYVHFDKALAERDRVGVRDCLADHCEMHRVSLLRALAKVRDQHQPHLKDVAAK